MNRSEAERLVETTFNKPYDEGRFRVFARNVFANFTEKSEGVLSGKMIWDAFKGNVTQYKRLGKYEDPEGYTVDVLAVKLKNAGTLGNARTLQRNFVAKYLNGGRGGVLRDAALVAFYADGSPDWRFSLVRMDYTIDETKSKVRKDFTPARRYSFLVGGNEKTHTAKRQLATLLQGGPVTLTELEKAFNIESVTKEFFEKYKTLFLNLKEELDGLEQQDLRIRQEFAVKNIDTATFAKRLLGQIVFLYFLQKKGWLGVGRNADGSLEPWGGGPKDFLRRLFDKQVVPYDNFFDDLLEPLFYEALASDRGVQSFYSRFNCRIPFLNGGLFEPVGDYNWEETRINLKNETFGQIFSTFDLYNFTVREDEPLDKEVAVDPEMLGKVFENLLEVKDRKSKGAFYTPREIVHYMCQESLINYLDTALNTVTRPLLTQDSSQDDLFGRPQTRQAPLTEEYEEQVPRADLAEFIRLGDAAQEHDAATAARVKETDAYSFKVPESVRQHAAPLDGALASIKICDPAIGSGAFPVGMMNEIVRARGALNAYLGTEGRAAYDFKRHAIQESIYGVDIEESAVDIAKLWLSLIVDEDDYGTIKPLPNLEYKIVIGNSLLGVEETLFNNDLFERLEQLKGQYFSETRQGEKGRLKGEIAALMGQLTRGEVDFDFKVYFSEVFQEKGGFDIVIGNPPYLGGRDWKEESGNKQNYFATRYYVAEYQFDIYVLFWERGIRLLGRGGTIAFITPNTWLNNQSNAKLRTFILEQTAILGITDYSRSNVFPNAVVLPIVTILAKTTFRDKYANIYLPDNMAVKLARQVPLNLWEADKYKIFNIDLQAEDVEIRLKMELSSKELASISEVKFGIKLYETGKGKPPQKASDAKEKVFEAKIKLNETYRPYLEGKDVARYEVKRKGRWLKYGANLAAPRNPTLFEGPRLLVRRIVGKRMIATFTESDFVTSQLLQIVKPYNQFFTEYVLGIVNSTLIAYYFRKKYNRQDKTFPEIRIYELASLPIRTINPSDPTDKAMYDRMVSLVSRMLSLHEEKGQGEGARPVAELEADIRATDAEIDALVYRLYGLTDEEIKIVEGSAV